MSGVIRYNFAGLDTLSGDLRGQFQRLEELSGQLKKQVTALASHWDSGGAVSYQQAQAQWDRLFGDARTRLDSLGVGVQRAATQMRETDLRVSRTFGA
ncbi:WXG100 family type VII secretion target [Gordonia sp. HY285]|uniref:ESAT-6-like protein n=1 Tax=Gordonia liuliyuniae TaxID=2911517 RepID=A0ABS9INB7_9ACTN|nr:WXG100 family type VII secretion target [Gordonia liuliyuniae]MCF8587048.1 WXG100 family type VII secretion target [Gordonia liuliyuniae]MCF8609892.1 WXG100 family type VII secretion target [Gordonia liuliyuniae]